MPKVKGDFAVTGWDERTIEELGGKAKLTHASIAQDYTGALEGKGTWELLMYYKADGTAVYSGYGKFAGEFEGGKGAFVMESDGAFDGSAARSKWSVIEGSASGGLTSLTGEGTSEAPHGSTGTYELTLTKS